MYTLLTIYPKNTKSYPHFVDNSVDNLWKTCGKVENLCGKLKFLQNITIYKIKGFYLFLLMQLFYCID